MGTEAQPLPVRHKLVHELKEYAGLSLYLYVCFGAILLYKAAVLVEHGVGYAPFGLAAAKALVLAKFMLIGRAAHLGERHRGKPLINGILYKSVVFLVVLVAFSALEELAVGAVHGRTVSRTIAERADGRWFEIGATCFLLWLILLPYFGFRQIGEALGEGELKRMLFGKR